MNDAEIEQAWNELFRAVPSNRRDDMVEHLFRQIHDLRKLERENATLRELLRIARWHIDHCRPNWRANQSRPDFDKWVSEATKALKTP